MLRSLKERNQLSQFIALPYLPDVVHISYLHETIALGDYVLWLLRFFLLFLFPKIWIVVLIT